MPSSYNPPASVNGVPINPSSIGPDTGTITGTTITSNVSGDTVNLILSRSSEGRYLRLYSSAPDDGLGFVSKQRITGSDGVVGISGVLAVGNIDTQLSGPAANTLVLRNGTNGQTLVISRTYTDPGNKAEVAHILTGSTYAFTVQEAGTGVGTIAGYSFDRTLSVQDGVNPKSLQVYNTTAGGNSEYATFDWTTTSNILTIATKASGTGTARAISILAGVATNGAGQIYVQSDGTISFTSFNVAERWKITSGGNFIAASDNANDIGDATHAPRKVTTNTLNIKSIPTSASGLSSGDVWSNLGILTIVS